MKQNLTGVHLNIDLYLEEQEEIDKNQKDNKKILTFIIHNDILNMLLILDLLSGKSLIKNKSETPGYV